MFTAQSRAAFTEAVEKLWADERTSEMRERGYVQHQAQVASFLSPDTPYRGLLVYHGLGTGKTAAASAAIEAWCARGGDQARVRIVTPASLKSNFVAELNRIASASSDTTPSIDPEDDPRFMFVSQNGLNKNVIKRLQTGGNAFDDSIVVVDEAHNISRSLATDEDAQKSSSTRTLYDLIRRAKRSKVMLMTATPIHNRVVELAYLVNMLAGPVTEHTVRFVDPATSGPDNARGVRTLLERDDRVDAFTVTDTGASFQLVQDPRFRMPDKASGALVLHESKDPSSNSSASASASASASDPGSRSSQCDLDDMAKQVVKSIGSVTTCGAATAREFDLLPTNGAEFDALFVRVGGSLTNRGILLRRLMGRVSAFDVTDVEAYPRVRRSETVFVPMGRGQLVEYIRARTYERTIEDKSMGGDDDVSVFRAYSRMASNFVFPIGRRGRRKFKFEERTLTDDRYQQMTTTAISEIRRGSFWRDDKTVKRFAPKFVRIFRRISAENAGKSMVYSVFRTTEGIGLFAELLLARGWRQITTRGGKLELVSHGKNASGPCFVSPRPGDRDNQALVALFNGRRLGHGDGHGDDRSDGHNHGHTKAEHARFEQLATLLEIDVAETANIRGLAVRTILLSRSGAEGLNLSEVRQVHMMEPHWNAIQLDQVRGRAIRMHSHARLPDRDRTVSVWTYIATLGDTLGDTSEPDAEPEPNPLVQVGEKDRGVSTDEYVAASAMRKTRMSIQILDMMREVSVDCSVNQPGTGRACYVPPPRTGNMVPPRVFDDRDDELGPGRKLRVPLPDGTTRDVAVFEGSSDVYSASGLDEHTRVTRDGLEIVGKVTRAGLIAWKEENAA